MANLVLIVGPQGSGKTTSFEKLNPKETYLINCANKPLPFEGSGEFYQEGTNLANTHDSPTIVSALDLIDKNPNLQHIKNVLIDDSGFVMTEKYFEKVDEKGYDKFTFIAKQYQSILSKCKSMRPDLNIAVVMHDEAVISNGIIVERKGKTVGKMVDDQYDPLSLVAMALFTDVIFDKDGVPQYNFITNRCMKAGVVIPAKTPKGMFKDLRIPNDISAVFARAREYYKN